MHFIIGIIVFLFALVAVVLLVVFSYVIRGWRLFRRTMRGDYTDEEVERMSNKYYREPDANFGADYFRTTNRPKGNAGGQRSRSTKTTTTDEGVTIIDQRAPQERKRKIFTHDEGEYVEFEEG